MMWSRIVWLFILLLLGKHYGFPSSERYLELADSADFYIAHQNWIKAEDAIIRALRLEPANFSNSLLLANLGLVQANMGDYNKSLQSLSLGLNIAPSSTVLLNNRAHTYLLMDSIVPASIDLDKSLRIDSIQEWTLQSRAFIYLQEGDIASSRKIFNKLRKEFPDNSGSLSGLAAIAESEGNWPVAVDLYRKALEISPEDEETKEAYIFLLINMEDYSKARSELRKAIEENPENPVWYVLRGYLHKLNFRPTEAEADRKTAIAKGADPQFVAKFIH